MKKEEQEVVLNKMLGRLFGEDMKLIQEERQIEERLHEIANRRMEIALERKYLESSARKMEVEHVRSIIDPKPKKEVIKNSTNRMTLTNKHNAELAVKKIMKEFGRPAKTGEIIKELKQYGYEWNTYVSAAAFINKLDILETVSHGYKQLKK